MLRGVFELLSICTPAILLGKRGEPFNSQASLCVWLRALLRFCRSIWLYLVQAFLCVRGLHRLSDSRFMPPVIVPHWLLHRLPCTSPFFSILLSVAGCFPKTVHLYLCVPSAFDRTACRIVLSVAAPTVSATYVVPVRMVCLFSGTVSLLGNAPTGPLFLCTSFGYVSPTFLSLFALCRPYRLAVRKPFRCSLHGALEAPQAVQHAVPLYYRLSLIQQAEEMAFLLLQVRSNTNPCRLQHIVLFRSLYCPSPC